MSGSLKSVSSELPDPPYPRETQAGTFPLEVDVHRLLQSDTWCLLDPTLQAWALKAWVVSWSQTPCGAFRDDLEIIAAKLGCDQKFLQLHRDAILRNWRRCADGRLYHPVITEKVLAFLDTREKWRNKKKQQRTSNVQGDSFENPGSVPGVSPPSSSSSSSSSSSYKPNSEVLGKGGAGGEPCTRIPARKIAIAWYPGENTIRWLAEHGISDAKQIDGIVREFRAYWIERGTKRSNWDLAFRRNTVVKSQIQKIRSRESENGKPRSASERARAAREELDARREAEEASRRAENPAAAHGGRVRRDVFGADRQPREASRVGDALDGEYRREKPTEGTAGD